MLGTGTLNTKNVSKQFLLFILIMSITSGMVVAQSTTNVSITGIPGILPSPFFSDFEQNVYNGVYQVQANVVGNSSVNVRFHVTISKDGQELMDETSLPVELDPGMNLLSPFPNFVEFSKTTNQVLNDLPSEMVQQVFQGGTFPEGDYTITMQAYEVGSNIPAGSSGVATFMVRYPQPSILLTPANATTVDIDFPVFSWTPVMAPQGTTIEYDFLLVEVFDGQNPGDALLSNREHAAVQLIGNTTLPYTGEYLPLEQGKTYAWQVTARDANDQIPIKNNGRSEIYVFTYGEEPDEDEEIDFLATPVTDFDFEPMFIPISTISGNVNFRFSPTEGGSGVETMFSTITESRNVLGDVQFTQSVDDPNFQTGVNIPADQLPPGSVNGTIPVNTVPVFGGGNTNSAEVQQFDFAGSQIQDAIQSMGTHSLPGVTVKAVYKKRDGTSKVLSTATADEDGSFTLALVPSELEELSDSESESGGLSTSWGDFQPQNVNMNDLRNQARRNITEPPVSRVTVHIVVDSPYFEFTSETTVEVNTNSTEQLNAGTLTGTALTYRLQPEVVDRHTGASISDATVEVFRQNSRYIITPYLQEEGWPKDEEDENGQEVILGQLHTKIAEGPADAVLTRLFSREKGPNDIYRVRISARGYQSELTSLSASPALQPFESVTINQEYELLAALPLVEGRVVRSDTQAPMADVPVQLRPLSGDGFDDTPQLNQFTMTDEDGRFTFSRIIPRDENYRLIVSGDRVETYEEDLLLDERGIVVERDPIMLDPTLITVMGRVHDDQGEPVPSASVRWKEGGTPVQTDNRGRFVTANTIGTHQLQVRKIGHRDVDTTLTVQLTDETEYDYSPDTFGQEWSPQMGGNYANAAGQWAGNLVNTDMFQDDVEEEDDPPFNPAGFGYFGNMANSLNVNEEEASDIAVMNNLNMTASQFGNTTAYFSNLFGEYGIPGDFYNTGTIIMNRAVGKLDVTVQDSDTGDPVPEAVVEVGLAGLQGNTDSDGHIYFDEAPGGTVPVSITAPETTFYVPLTTEVTITDNGEVTYIDIPLESGSRTMGVVTANGEPVEDASVRVEGRDDISTTTDSDGNYILAGIPAGEWTLRTTASGLVGASETRDFTAEEEITINFNLQDAGFNIATLLGFDIEVDEISTASDTTLTGAFVSIPSNPLLSVSDDLRIPFSGILVYEEGGDLRPVGGEVQTDVSELQAELFDFLIVTVSSPDGLIVRPREIMSDIGYIAGVVEADYSATFTSATGWQWPDVDNQYLSLPDVNDLPGSVSENELVALTSDGSFPFPDIGVPDFELAFGSASAEFSVFGFDMELALNESVLKNDGFHLNGGVNLSEIPLLDEATIDLESLWIGTDGSVKEAQLELDPHPELVLANWKMALFAGGISETGLNVGGALEFNIPGSDITEISFSDLLISSDQIHGGHFTFPADGIDIFGIVEMNSRPGKDITFGKVQGEHVYYVTGGATIDLPRYVDKSLVFRDFLIRTDGEFNANIAANFEADFWGLADLSVTGVRFQNTSNPAIHVDGQFGLHGIPFVSAQAGGLSYRPGGSVSFEELDFEFDLASIGTVGAGIGLIDTAVRQGFSGSGSMEITGTPIAAGIEFYYERMDDGISFGGNVEAGIPPIPVGNFAIENVGGGFTFDSSDNEFSVTISGRVAVAPGTGQAISLDPLQVTVASGPVIEGHAALSVMSQEIANADLKIDFPNRLIDITAGIEFSQLNRVNISANTSTRLVVSGAPNNSYWMVGARLQADLLRLFSANANILAAWNLNASDYPDETSFVDSQFITGGTITGVHLDVATEFGRPESNPACFGRSYGKACGYFWNETRCRLNADFGGGNFGLYLGTNWEVGGWVEIFGLDIVSAHGQASGSVEGGYNRGTQLWWASGQASGSIWGHVGSCDTGCSNSICTKWKVIPTGGSVCASVSIGVDYYSDDRGMSISIN